MPLYDTASRLTSDRCYRALRDSDNRKLADLSLADICVSGDDARKKKKSANLSDDRIRKYITGARDDSESDSDSAKSNSKIDDSESDSDDNNAFMLISGSHFNVQDACDSPPPRTDGSTSRDSRSMSARYGFGVGPYVPAPPEELPMHEEEQRQPRMFVAAPNLGAHLPYRCADHAKAPASKMVIRRGGGTAEMYGFHAANSRRGPQPPGDTLPPAGGPATFCDTFLRERVVHTGKGTGRTCSAQQQEGRVVDRFAERTLDVFDPVVGAMEGADVNAVAPDEWVLGGAASRDIARRPEFLKVRGYVHDGRIWRKPIDTPHVIFQEHTTKM